MKASKILVVSVILGCFSTVFSAEKIQVNQRVSMNKSELSQKIASDKQLKPTNLDRNQLKKAKALREKYRKKQLSRKEMRFYEALLNKMKAEQKRASKKPVKRLTSASSAQRTCKCTAICQTIVWASNAGSYDWSVSGDVSSPSACADAAVATCGNAYMSLLKEWSCK